MEDPMAMSNYLQELESRSAFQSLHSGFPIKAVFLLTRLPSFRGRVALRREKTRFVGAGASQALR
jgi:predicted Zn-dependent protease